MAGVLGTSIVQGEVLMLLSATRKGSRWPNHSRTEESQDPLLGGLYRLQDQLNRTHHLSSMDVCDVIHPFCQIVQSDDTTGPVTGMAISSLEKFLAYNLIDPSHPSAPMAVKALSEAVTHARFVGTNPASDEVVLMKILQVLRTLLLSPVGRLLTNESVCEIMQSCFRICFEMRLSELLRCYGESTLMDLVQLLFSQLPVFSEEEDTEVDTSTPIEQTLLPPQQTTPPPSDVQSATPPDETETSPVANSLSDPALSEEEDLSMAAVRQTSSNTKVISSEDISTEDEGLGKEEDKERSLVPYGLSCVKEILRFLVSLINTLDSQNNSDALVGIGLNLVTVVIECGSSHLCRFQGLASIIQDTLCKHLIQLLRHESFVLFSRALRCCCLLFHSCRSFLKLQLEMFMNRLMELIATDPISRVVYEKRELALESIIQLCHVPYFTAELFVNFDCGLYCTNVFENLTKLLSKSASPTQGTLSYAHVLALEALLAIAKDLEPSAEGGRSLTDSQHTGSAARMHDSSESSTYNTRINSAGIIFSKKNINQDEGISSSTPLSSSTPSLPQPQSPLFQGQESGGAITRNKLPSGYQVGVATREGMAKEMRSASVEAPLSKDLLQIRQKKKLILAGTELFNEKRPKEGIQFLCEQGILKSPPQPQEVADFLWQNHALNKAKIGEYIGKSDNVDMLEAFVSIQKLRGVALLDALRVFLEAFRLPGEAQIVTRVLELFSQYWLDSNSGGGGLGEMFENRDAVFVLSYSIMMLNTDLHNDQNKKKMTLNEYIRNQRKTNNGKSFPESFLSEIYAKIRDEEIILPAERAGAVKENYQWKLLLQRSSGHEGAYVCVTDSSYAYDIFLITWGPIIAALSYIYDNADDKIITKKAISGFSKCASVAAHFELKEVFDKLIITLCKFTTLLNTHENTSSLFYSLGVNPKVRQSIRTTFDLAYNHANILREGWQDLLNCLLALFKAQLLPTHMVQVCDFLTDKYSLYRNETQSSRNESSLLSSFYSYISFSQEPIPSMTTSGGSSGQVGVVSGRGLSASEVKARTAALKCVESCHPELLYIESRFLREDALLELIKALIFASRSPEYHSSLGTTFDEAGAVFFLGILFTVAIENKDRARLFWLDLSSHLSTLILSAINSYPFLLERGVVFLLHLVLRVLGRGDFPIDQVLSSLSVLFSLPGHTPPTPSTLHLQVAHGITEIVRTHAATLTTSYQWRTVFSLLEFTGARVYGAIEGMAPPPPPVMRFGRSSSREEADGGLYGSSVATTSMSSDGCGQEVEEVDMLSDSFVLLNIQSLEPHDPQAFFKACECLMFITRSDPLITADNFTPTIRCIRHFTEIASGATSLEYDRAHTVKSPRNKKDKVSSPRKEHAQKDLSMVKSSSDSTSLTYGSSLLQLLDLLDALYSKVGQIFDEKTLEHIRERLEVADRALLTEKPSMGRFGSVSDESVDSLRIGKFPLPPGGCGLMWQLAWCPILQGMAWLCCCSRSSVRQTAITYLQRALLSHDLHDLSGEDWNACFTQVFFPMLSRLLEEKDSSKERVSLEETRVRASNLLCKVFLQHLPSLYQRSDDFSTLWLHILGYMDRYLHLPNSELLHEAIPESLKNMLLVMSTQGIFDSSAINQSNCSTNGSSSKARKLWWDTWNRIDQFLPGFLQELFPHETPPIIDPSTDPAKQVIVPQQNDKEEQVKGGTEGECPATDSSQDLSGSLAVNASSSDTSVVLPGASPGSSPPLPSHLPPITSKPITPPSSPTMNSDPSFPVVLHTPLPTLSPHQVTQEAATPTLPSSMVGPILITAAPPYSSSAEPEPNSVVSIPYSSVPSL